MYTYLFVCLHTCHSMDMEIIEQFMEWVLLFYNVLLGIKVKLSSFVTIMFTNCTISLVTSASAVGIFSLKIEFHSQLKTFVYSLTLNDKYTTYMCVHSFMYKLNIFILRDEEFS